MNKYRRIEINAFRRRVTIVSGEWPSNSFQAQPQHADGVVTLDDSDSSVPVATDSPEGQLILVEAMRSLERRLLPEVRAPIASADPTSGPIEATGLSGKLKSFGQFIWALVWRST
jgi:hypothetical protein